MTTRRTLPLLAASALLAFAPASARAQEREKPPQPEAPRPFTLPTPTRFTLPSGLKVSLVPYGTIPKALVRLTVQVGNADEAANQVWMADLTGDLLLEGTKTRSASRIAQDAAAMGGEVAVQAGENLTTVGGEVLSEFTPTMVDLVADVARNPAFPESEFPSPSKLPRSANRALSVNNCRSTRERPAPMASRMAISLCRSDARASSSPASSNSPSSSPDNLLLPARCRWARCGRVRRRGAAQTGRDPGNRAAVGNCQYASTRPATSAPVQLPS